MDQYIGKLLDNRYEILEQVGSGGMSIVYKARCHRLNRLVAIKILKEELAQDAEFRRRFHDESQAVAMLSHPNIVSVYDVSRSAELDYIVMELIDGITLKQYMQKKGDKLSLREALHFITQIMKGLSHAHSRGIIHRDIKPHNIMVLRDGSAKVADFGIARLTSASQATFTQEALGSVHYISPEQAKGSHIDARSDVYSAGVVLYEMITGRLPYEGESPVAVAIQHINAIPLSPREIDPEIPEAMEAITMKAMASDVNQRYISADAMLEDLEEFRKNPSISFSFTPADLLQGSGDEPTQVLGSNTPQLARYQTGGGNRQSTARTRVQEDPYDDLPVSRRPAIIAACAIGVFVVCIIIFLYFSFFKPLSNNDEFATPNLIGSTVEEARANATVQEYGLEIKIGATEPSTKYAEGYIIAQDPGNDTEITRGDTIVVTVSSGTDTNGTTMPDVYNTSWLLAKTRLEDLGLNLNIRDPEESYHDTVTKGNVISITPGVGESLREGDTVQATISLGPQPLTVVSYIGKTADEAKQMAEANDLTYGGITGHEPSDEYEAGLVISQSLEVKSEVAKGTAITFVLSSGPASAVSATPSDAPSPSPVQSPASSPAASATPAEATRTVTVDLPDDGRRQVRVEIWVDGTKASEDLCYTNTRVLKKDISASVGTHEISVYIDNEIYKTYTEDFG